MKAMTLEELRKWCKSSGKHITKDHFLRYRKGAAHQFFVAAPGTYRQILAFIRCLLTFRTAANFYGGVLWLQWWEIGSPEFAQVGWRTIENIRRAHGEIRSLEIASALAVRGDEFMETCALLLHVIGQGWMADWIPFAGEFFAHFTTHEQVCFSAHSAGTLNELRDHLKEWNPTDEDPMVLKVRESERRHRLAQKTRSSKKGSGKARARS